MGLSTERKVFVAILAVAGAALVIDRGLLGPSSAAASSSPEAPASQEAPLLAGLTPASNPGDPQSAAQILINRLSKTAGAAQPAPQASLSSAFSLEQLIEPVMESVIQQSGNTAPQEPPQRPSLPVLTPVNVNLPTLTAVMPASNGGGAVLNGKLVRVGQTGPLGFTLREVRERGVILELEGRLYTIEIPMQAGP